MPNRAHAAHPVRRLATLEGAGLPCEIRVAAVGSMGCDGVVHRALAADLRGRRRRARLRLEACALVGATADDMRCDAIGT
jgi:hypothetical protein